MDLEFVVFEHLQEDFAEVFEEFVVQREALEHFVVGVFEGELREVAGEETPGCGGAASVRGAEEDYAAG